MNNRIHHLYHPPLYDQAGKNQPKTNETTKNFRQILNDQQNIKVSKHAKKRIIERGIHLTEQQWSTLNTKLKEAKQKGVREAVVILRDATLLVNAQKHTVITALNNDEAEDKVFTNINGTIIINK